MKITKVAVGSLITLVVFGIVWFATAQTGVPLARFEVAIVKWDGPDKLQFITPQKSEVVRLFKTAVNLPENIHDEEFCLMWAANRMAQDGWEPLNLDGTRMAFRRPVIR